MVAADGKAMADGMAMAGGMDGMMAAPSGTMGSDTMGNGCTAAAMGNGRTARVMGNSSSVNGDLITRRCTRCMQRRRRREWSGADAAEDTASADALAVAPYQKPKPPIAWQQDGAGGWYLPHQQGFVDPAHVSWLCLVSVICSEILLAITTMSTTHAATS